MKLPVPAAHSEGIGYGALRRAAVKTLSSASFSAITTSPPLPCVNTADGGVCAVLVPESTSRFDPFGKPVSGLPSGVAGSSAVRR